MNAPRRVLPVAVALGAAAVLFHGQLAAAIVTRGDDALHAGDIPGALRLYDRAARLDPQSPLPADRLAFYLAMSHDRVRSLQAIGVADRALARSGPDAALLADRAFAEVQLHRWSDAERDFARAGTLGRDARYEHFAARMALHVNDRRAARMLAQRALAFDPAFAPARTLLGATR